MRNARILGVGFSLLAAAACGGGGNGNPGGNGTSGATSGGTSGGTTTGGTTTGGKLLVGGVPCTANDQCQSGVCGTNGSGLCCNASCNLADPSCGATGCDVAGLCAYPDSTVACGTDACGNAHLTSHSCDGAGSCGANQPVACAGNYGCNASGTACNTNCASSADCAATYVCNNGSCTAPIVAGACTEDDDCYSKHCGIDGAGFCCSAKAGCVTGDPVCGAKGCDPFNGQCQYADAGTACGSTLASCTAGVQQDPSICDGQGNCPTPGTKVCDPFVCGPNACLTSCSDNSACNGGTVCDLSHAACCTPLVSGASIVVDATAGNDATPCCSIPGYGPCQSLTRAMTMIDEFQASGVTIKATVRKASTWNPPTEVYPIVLGWGVEVSAAGVFFYDPNAGGSDSAIFDVKAVSANDTIGYASIIGSSTSQVNVGWDEFSEPSTDPVEIEVESGSTLYLANAYVNGSVEISNGLNQSTTTQTTAIAVHGGGSLVVGQDQSGAVTGPVTIGNANNTVDTDGWKGIVCSSNNGTGCTVTDATLKAGQSALTILGQESVDIDAEDYASITLTQNPVIGVAPTDAGFGTCPAKVDGQQGNLGGNGGAAVLVNGNASVTFNNGTVQCIGGDGFQLNASSNGTPTLAIDNTTVQHTAHGINAQAGTAKVTNSTIIWNYIGVVQDTDGTNVASIDLSGSTDGGTTTVICSDNDETNNLSSVNPGVSVLNRTTKTLKADNVTWDTPTPDLFSCDAKLDTCTCESSSCDLWVGDGGVNGMDAVYTSTGTVSTGNNQLSPVDCNFPPVPINNTCIPPCNFPLFCCELPGMPAFCTNMCVD